MSGSGFGKQYFVVKYAPDGAGAPYFFGTDWKPELPSIHLPSKLPELNSFASEYVVSAKTPRYEADLNVDQLLASEALISVCDKLKIPYFSRPVKVVLYGGREARNKYFLFFPLSRLELMDRSLSDFKESEFVNDQASGQSVETRKEGSYDAITKFVQKPDVSEDLLYCIEIKETVCSGDFKEAFESMGLTGVDFIPIDENYRYDPWGDFCS